VPLLAARSTSPVHRPVTVAQLAGLGGPDGSEVYTAPPRAMRLELVTDGTITPDGITSFAAAGGKVWRRDRLYGSEAAASQSTWYVRAAGDNNADGSSPATAVASIEEVFARWGDRPLAGHFTIDAPDDDSASHSLTFRAKDGAVLIVQGARTDTSGDLTVSAATPWAIASMTEGTFTVPGRTWSAGTLVHVASGGGAYNGVAIGIGRDLGSGKARAGGGSLYGAWVQPGWVVRTHRPTRWSGSHAFRVEGDGYMLFYDLELGPAGAGQGVIVRESGELVVFTDCILHGLVTATPGASVGVIGGYVAQCVAVAGVFITQGTVIAKSIGALTLGNVLVNLDYGTLLEGSILCGSTFPNGGATIEIAGAVAICDYGLASILNYRSTVDVSSSGRLWARDAAGATYGFILNPGCAIDAQAAANLPSVVGTPPSSGAYLLGSSIRTQAQVNAITLAAPLVNNNAVIGVKT